MPDPVEVARLLVERGVSAAYSSHLLRAQQTAAAVAAAAALLLAGSSGQVIAIALGAVAGYFFCRAASMATGGALHFPVRRGVGAASLVLFGILLLGLPVAVIATGSGGLALFDAFYRAGSLVFGGGHVVLPLLQSGVVETGWVGAVVSVEVIGGMRVVGLEDRHGRVKSFPLGPGFLLDGEPVRLGPPVMRTASAGPVALAVLAHASGLWE